jgi:hypothetical protein
MTRVGSDSSNTNRRAQLAAALGCGAASVLLTWAAATGAPGLHVPPAIAVLVAGVLAVAGWRLGQLYRGAGGAGDGSAVLILAGMAALAFWIAAGSGSRSCGIGIGARALSGAAGLGCRIPFGVGGLIVAVAALYALRRWARTRRAARREA